MSEASTRYGGPIRLRVPPPIVRYVVARHAVRIRWYVITLSERYAEVMSPFRRRAAEVAAATR